MPNVKIPKMKIVNEKFNTAISQNKAEKAPRHVHEVTAQTYRLGLSTEADCGDGTATGLEFVNLGSSGRKPPPGSEPTG